MKTHSADFLHAIHNRTAEAAVGPSVLRNQGASGVIRVAEEYFKRLNGDRSAKDVDETKPTSSLRAKSLAR